MMSKLPHAAGAPAGVRTGLAVGLAVAWSQPACHVPWHASQPTGHVALRTPSEQGYSVRSTVHHVGSRCPLQTAGAVGLRVAVVCDGSDVLGGSVGTAVAGLPVATGPPISLQTRWSKIHSQSSEDLLQPAGSMVSPQARARHVVSDQSRMQPSVWSHAMASSPVVVAPPVSMAEQSVPLPPPASTVVGGVIAGVAVGVGSGSAAAVTVAAAVVTTPSSHPIEPVAHRSDGNVDGSEVGTIDGTAVGSPVGAVAPQRCAPIANPRITHSRAIVEGRASQHRLVRSHVCSRGCWRERGTWGGR